MRYTLTTAEQEAVAKIEEQSQEAKNIANQASEILKQQQKRLLALEGAKQGIILLIASQQGLMKAGTETVSLNADGTELVVEEPVE